MILAERATDFSGSLDISFASSALPESEPTDLGEQSQWTRP
jgi:hypothetical protein